MEEKIKLFDEFPQVTTSEWEAQIQADLKGADYEKKLIWKTYEGIPVKPYYRADSTPAGIHIPNVPGNWEIRQDIFEEDITTINSIAKDIAVKGAEGLGLNCINVKTYADISQLLSGIDPEKTSIHITKCNNYTEFLSLFCEYISKQGIDRKRVKGSLNYDPFASLLCNGTLEKNTGEHIKEAGLLLNMAAELPGFSIISVHGNLFNEAGATVTQELAYSLAIGHEYLYLLHNAGVDTSRILNNFQIVLSSGSNYFMEIAKYRAIRLLWSQITAQYGHSEIGLQLVVSSSKWNKTLYDPHVNMLRSTTEAMSAAIGGADIIQIDPFDIVYTKPDEFSMRMARNQQIILKEESWLNKVTDPSAGSYYIENLTRLITETTWKMFREIESEGGFQVAFANGSISEKTEAIARQRLQDMANRKTIVLGTNQYPNTQENSGSSKPVENTDCSSHKGLRFFRLSEEFEAMRKRTEKFENEKGQTVRVFLFTIGNLAMRKARAMFATNFFGCAGFKVIDNPGFDSVEEGLIAWKETNAEILVICSSDEEYQEFVPVLCSGLVQENKKPLIILAGYPKEQIELYKKAGVDDFIHVRSNVLETLTNYQVILGM